MMCEREWRRGDTQPARARFAQRFEIDTRSRPSLRTPGRRRWRAERSGYAQVDARSWRSAEIGAGRGGSAGQRSEPETEGPAVLREMGRARTLDPRARGEVRPLRRTYHGGERLWSARAAGPLEDRLRGDVLWRLVLGRRCILGCAILASRFPHAVDAPWQDGRRRRNQRQDEPGQQARSARRSRRHHDATQIHFHASTPSAGQGSGEAHRDMLRSVYSFRGDGARQSS
jgi:hypothetical protein